MTSVKIGLAQINTSVGNSRANASKILDAARWAHQNGVDILVMPELTLSGYPAEDLFLRPSFIAQQIEALSRLGEQLSRYEGLHVVVGHAWPENGRLYNAASVLVEGSVKLRYFKRELPDYGVFDETRYFSPGAQPAVFTVNGVKLGLNICEDAWRPDSPRLAAEHGAQALLIMNASPYSRNKQTQRLQSIQPHVRGMTAVYVNKVGGQDELVFDGGSFVLNAEGNTVLRLPLFDECLSIIEVDSAGRLRTADASPLRVWPSPCEEVYSALKLALHDYLGKSGFGQIVLGLSGGIDSALVLAIAVDAIGAHNVRAVMMPSRYTAAISLADARDMAKRLNVQYDEIDISDLAQAFDQALAPLFAGKAPDTTEENLQARIRGNLLMALSNKFGSLVLTTGNKSELATGYCTLYGDMAGGFALLKDVPKTLVYDLARWRNEQSAVIPQRIIDRPPSAELRPDQTDQDSLPPYEVLDAILERYIERNESLAQIEQAGFDREVVNQVARLVRVNEYKRRQGALGPKITSRAFGRDWRYPVTNGFRE